MACLTDVRAPLLGPRGAAAVFGPQKGADAAQIAVLEAGLGRLAAALGGDPGAPGSGAAGGTGYGLAAAWGAQIRPGAAEVGRIVGLDRQLAGADLVLTGEGRYDATSADGKVVGTRAGRGGAGGRARGGRGRAGRGRPAARGRRRWRWPALAGGSDGGHGQPGTLAAGGRRAPGARPGRRA